MHKIIVFILALIFVYSDGRACTIICLKDTTTVLLGKNLDWPIPQGTLFYNPAGLSKHAMFSNDAHWKAGYASLTVNQLGRNLPLGGMNEKGLVIESTAYSMSAYPESPGGFRLNEFEWIQYHLDTFSTTELVIESLETLAPQKWFIDLHYYVCDASGDHAFIEWIAGELRVYRGSGLPISVQSNNSYDNSLRYLKVHQGFGGQRVESNGPESQERFVRAARFTKDACPNPSVECLSRGLALVRQADTQWAVIYEPVSKQVNLLVGADPILRIFSLNKIANRYQGRVAMQSFSPPTSDSQNSTPSSYSFDRDRESFDHVLSQLVRIGDLNENDKRVYLGQWSSLQNRCEVENPCLRGATH